MDRKLALEITNVHGYIIEMQKVLNDFLAHLLAHAKPGGLPGKMLIQEQIISIECFGFTLSAEPRVVKDNQGDFAVEYLFHARQGEIEEELWRFYLTADRRLTVSLTGEDSICDSCNRYVAEYICIPVMHAALNSILFRPTE